MYKYFNQTVAAAARSAAMEAVNHLKNSAMEGDTISKHRRSSTSQKSISIFLWDVRKLFLFVVVLPMLLISSYSCRSANKATMSVLTHETKRNKNLLPKLSPELNVASFESRG